MTHTTPRRIAAAFAGLALLAWPAGAQVRSETAKAYSQRLASLTDIQRRAALRRAVLDSGEACVTVTKAAYQGTFKNLEMWVARCTLKAAPATADYAAFIGPDGTVQVSGCPYLRTVNWPACRKLD